MAQHAKLVLSVSAGTVGGTLTFLMNGLMQTFTVVNPGDPTSDTGGTYNSVATLYAAINYRAGAYNYVAILAGSQISLIAKTYNGSHNLGTVTSVNSGCSVDSQQNASGVDLAASAAKTDLTLPGADDGSITLTVSDSEPPYGYLWADGPTTANRTGLAPGGYSVEVSSTATDGAPPQTVNLSITILEAPVPVEFTGEVTNVACYGAATGEIALDVTAGDAPFSYLWNDGATTGDRTGLAAGSYTVVVTSDRGASASQIFEVSQPALIVISPSVTGNNVTLDVTGGVAPYTFLWNDGNTSASRTGLAVGAYSCEVTDANGCHYATVNINIGDYDFFFSRNPVILELAASSPETKFNLSFVLEVYVEEVYASNAFEKKITLEHPASSSGTTVFDVQSILDVYVRAALPTYNQSTVSRADNIFKRYYLKHAEKYGADALAEPVLQALVLELTNFVVLGGLSYEEYAAGTWFSSYQAANKPFFTWEPNNKLVQADQAEYLYFMVPSYNVTSFLARVQILYTDGSLGSHTFHTRTGVFRYEMYLLPAGYTQLNLAGYAPSKTVKSWKVYCTDADGNLLSEQRNYLLDSKYYPSRRYLLYLNSLGGFNTLFATGAAVKSLDVDQEELVRPLPFDYAIEDGASALVNKSGQQNLTLSTGYKSKAYVAALQDFLISEKVYLLENGRHIPVIVSPDTVDVSDEEETLSFLKFKVRPPRMYRYTPNL